MRAERSVRKRPVDGDPLFEEGQRLVRSLVKMNESRAR